MKEKEETFLKGIRNSVPLDFKLGQNWVLFHRDALPRTWCNIMMATGAML